MNSPSFVASVSLSEPEEVLQKKQTSAQHHPQALTWLKDQPWDALLSFTKHLHLRADLNERLYALLSEALSQCLQVVQEACAFENQARMDLAFKLLFIFPSCFFSS